MNNLKVIIEELKKVCEETATNPSDDCLFEEACKIYISGKIQEGKEKNIERVVESRKVGPGAVYGSKTSNSEALTEKQRKFLINNDYRGDIDSLSKEEAKVIIREFIEGNHG